MLLLCFPVARLWKDMRSRIENSDNEDPIDDDTDQQQCLMDKSKGLPEETFESGAATRRKDKFIHDREELGAAVMAVPSNKRRKTRHLAAVLDLPRLTVHCLLKQEKFFKRHTSAVKPKLTTANKHLRILHALEHIDQSTNH